MDSVTLHLEPSVSFAIMDEWLEALMLQDLEYLDLGRDEKGTWHARVTAITGGMNYRGCGFGTTRDEAKIYASNAALACLHQGQGQSSSNAPSSPSWLPQLTSASPASSMSSSGTTLCENFLNTPDAAAIDITAILEQNAALRAKNAELEDRLEEVRKVFLTTQGENEALRAKNAELEEDFEEIGKFVLARRDDDAALRAKNEELEEYLEETRKAILATWDENSKSSTKVTELQQRIIDQDAILWTVFVDSKVQKAHTIPGRKTEDPYSTFGYLNQTIRYLREQNKDLEATLTEEQTCWKDLVIELNRMMQRPCSKCVYLRGMIKESISSDETMVESNVFSQDEDANDQISEDDNCDLNPNHVWELGLRHCQQTEIRQGDEAYILHWITSQPWYVNEEHVRGNDLFGMQET